MDIVKKEAFDPIKKDWIKYGMTEETFAVEVSFACQHIYRNPYLQTCTRDSMLRAVLNVAQVGLTLNPVSKYAALIPRYNGKTKENECVLEPMYQGLMKLLTDSGAVKHMEAHVVHDGDDFAFDYGSGIATHIPYFLVEKAKGKIKAVYSKAVLKDGSHHLEIMSAADVYEIRERSESYRAYLDKKTKSCIWISDEQEMFRKTIIKRHQKYLPKSSEMEKFQTAIDLDNDINGRREEMGFGTAQWIEIMISQATMNDDEKQKYLKKLSTLQYEHEGHAMIKKLEPYVPIMGLDKIPTNVGEAAIATRNRIDIEDFKERDKEQ